MIRMETYFAYGANVNEDEMSRRCSSAEVISTGVLEDYQIAFLLHSERWGGGVAGIIPNQGSHVEGIIYRISTDDLKKLDEIENVHQKRYFRSLVNVHTKNGGTTEAWVYFPNPDANKKVCPSTKYLRTIIEGARRYQLSDGYIRELESFLPSK